MSQKDLGCAIDQLTVKLPAVVDMALQFDNTELWREIGVTFALHYQKRGKGRQAVITASREALTKIAREATDRADMNGGEGFQDEPSAIRACRETARRIAKALSPAS